MYGITHSAGKWFIKPSLQNPCMWGKSHLDQVRLIVREKYLTALWLEDVVQSGLHLQYSQSNVMNLVKMAVLTARFSSFMSSTCQFFTIVSSWCFEPSQQQRITSGLNTNFTLSPSQSHSFHKSSYHKSVFFFSLFIFRRHSTQEPASSRVTYFILRAYTGTSISQSQHRKKSGEVLEKIEVNGADG